VRRSAANFKKVKRRAIQFIASALDSIGFNKALEVIFKKKEALTILAYHGVHDPMLHPSFHEKELISAYSHEFARQLDYIKNHFTVISFAQLKEKLDAGSLSENSLIITFDDGFRDNYNIAFPLLKERNLPATIFLTTGHINTNNLIWFQKLFLLLKRTRIDTLHIKEPFLHINMRSDEEKSKAKRQIMQFLKNVPDEKRLSFIHEIEQYLGVQIDELTLPRMLLNWDEVREMCNYGIEFGSHTVTHPVLSQVSDEKLEFELTASKMKIELELKKEVTSISYPFGGKNAFDERIQKAVMNAGYDFGVSYIHGLNYGSTFDLFALNRLHIESVLNLPLFKIQMHWPELLPHSRG
jgi:peptidoglycan/xylan/chitin deacetylase (PgdA/CDA1 family)